ncbi:MAG: isocitrate/isopropylmalate dehydrogenase family protein [Oscillospiraceae bacterium]|nr:isocitrate/isopropylmalate dehydrogenase family protein [Oscillospiraceae bacterium]
MREYSVARMPGDGIGPEIIREGVKVLDAVSSVEGFRLNYTDYPYGGEYYLQTGTVIPQGGFEELRQQDAIFFGAVGDPRVTPGIIEQELLLAMRTELDQYINLRPARLWPGVESPVKGTENFQVQVVRENTEGFYVRTGAAFEAGCGAGRLETDISRGMYDCRLDIRSSLSNGDSYAYNLGLITAKGSERIARYAFELARRRGLKKVSCITKRNAVPQMYSVWERAFESVAAEYPDIATEKMNVDAAAMWLVKKPMEFSVILAPNLFGDILSDLTAGICGSLGFGASGNINPAGVSMFEPIHGSAPKYAGRNIANPVAAILAGALMLDHLGERSAAQRIETAIEEAMREGAFRTHDMGGEDGTDFVGDVIRDRILRTA